MPKAETYHLTYRGKPLCECNFLLEGMRRRPSCSYQGKDAKGKAFFAAHRVAKHNNFDVARIAVVAGECPTYARDRDEADAWLDAEEGR